MNNNITKVFIKLTIIAIMCFIANTFIFLLPQMSGNTSGFIYPVWMVYLYFLAFSWLIIYVLFKVKKSNEAQLGYTFLGLTTLKLVISYIFIRPVINAGNDHTTEKYNFFAVFILFLAIEVYYTARLLNNKQ